MNKKIFKIFGIIILSSIIALIAAPFIFKGKIKELVIATINKNLDANVSFTNVDLSFIKSFPKATVVITDLAIINKAPFDGDTLFYAQNLNLKMALTELMKGDGEAMEIEGFSASNSVANIIFNKDGVGNFDIALKDDKQKEEDKESAPLALAIDGYKIENLKFTFENQASNMKMVLDSIYHTGEGSFKNQIVDLNTKTTTNLVFTMDSVNYVNKAKLTLDAVLGIDLNNQKYSFKENKALINQLPLEFDGFIQLTDLGQLYDLTFKTPESSFKNFLGLIPQAYSGMIANVKTEGDFKVSGKVKGELKENVIPTFTLAMKSNNASFQYPDLPKAVKNIHIDVDVANTTGNLNDTYVDINNLSFKIDQDQFNAQASVKNFIENALVNAKLNGTINLANLSKAYPIKLDKPLTGILVANIATKFDMKSVEVGAYQNMVNQGNLTLTGFNYTGPEMANTVIINKAALTFNPSNITLNTFDFKTGKSDLNVTGALHNFYGFAFKKETLRGNFNLASSHLEVADFMSTSTPANTKSTKEEAAIKVPSFLDCTLNAKAKTVVYDNLNLKDVEGTLIIKDQTVTLQNVKTNIFGGAIGMNGSVSTKNDIPTFNMKLGLNQLDITQSFTQFEFLKKIAPIANVIVGKLNSEIALSGNLDPKELTPNLNTLTGDLVGQLLNTSVKAENSKLLSTLDSNLNFIDLSKLNLNDLKTHIAFANGKVKIKPFTLKYQDIAVNIGGEHGFDQNMNYKLDFDVPVKYLGKDINTLISKLSAKDQAAIQNVPIIANLTGNFGSPKVSTDLKTALSNLTNQLVKSQKEQLVEKGTDKLIDLLTKNKNNNSTNTATTTDSTSTTTTKTETQTKQEKAKEDIKNTANTLKDLFKKK